MSQASGRVYVRGNRTGKRKVLPARMVRRTPGPVTDAAPIVHERIFRYTLTTGLQLASERHFQMQILRRADWVSTVMQGAPRLGALLRNMRPTIHLASVAALDPVMIHALGTTGIIWDVDGTLMGRHGTAVAPDLESAFSRLLSEPELHHVILSNCDERRFVELSSIFPAIPVIRIYDGPDGLIVRRRIGSSDSCFSGDCVVRQPVAAALRKPDVSLVRAALAELGCSAPSDAVMVGDQYLTDVAPANIVGVRTVKVRTVQPHSFPVAVRVLQAAERVLYKLSPSR